MNYKHKIDCWIIDSKKHGFVSPFPPFYKLLWIFGIEPRPFYFLNFRENFFWGLLQCTLVFIPMLFGLGQPVRDVLIKGICLGIFGGLLSGVFYSWKAYQLKLPSWENYPLIKSQDSSNELEKFNKST